MTCEHCGATGATYRVTERAASGFVEVRYCEACCRTRAGLPDRPPEGLYSAVDRAAGVSRVVTLDEIIALVGRPDEP